MELTPPAWAQKKAPPKWGSVYSWVVTASRTRPRAFMAAGQDHLNLLQSVAIKGGHLGGNEP